MFLSALFLASAAVTFVRAQQSSSFPAGVIATGTQGVTNPPVPTAPTAINQTSMARLLSLNSVDDFCIFAPPYQANISDTEQIEVAWCTQARNNARVIPDGTITGLSFLKTDFYVQLIGYGDFTKLNIVAGDEGGELDPHGATGNGNPIGGNVTTNVVDGLDEPIAEWMLYIDDNQFCIRACTNANSTYSAAFMCWHELDEMGCEFVMPGNYDVNGTFETCEADVAYPPGWYPTATVDGVVSFSTFAQYFEGVYTGSDGSTTSYTVGTTVTPSSAYFTPSSSACTTTSTISNGIALASLTSGAVGTAPPAVTGSAGSAPGVSTGSAKSGSTAGAGAGAGSGAGAGAGSDVGGSSPTTSGSAATGSSAAFRSASIGGSSGEYAAIALVSLFSGLAAVGLLH
ncbi:hypothetical protein DFH07DRAFT_521225 [Mycena maculata]|uniref:Immunoreactive mannoprotein MP88 n=1 Tax=Mycena maculata TaxID=230809 RepID=A0AAD7IXB0_9AGAR|nr:hypothetical protein DFH07DRAFT_521225 [Mycena maculata]